MGLVGKVVVLIAGVGLELALGHYFVFWKGGALGTDVGGMGVEVGLVGGGTLELALHLPLLLGTELTRFLCLGAHV